MQYWAVMDHRKTPQITYQCTGCGCRRVMDTVDEKLPRVCPNCRENMEVRKYPFFVHRLAKEDKDEDANKG